MIERAGGIDKLDVGISRKASYRNSFAKLIEISQSPEWRAKAVTDGGHYRQRIDMREVSGGELPVIVHFGNKHDSKADDKVELIETGGQTLRQMKETISEMYIFPPDDARVMRLDLCSDVEGTPVEWFRENTYVAMKQTHRMWHEVSSRRAQSIYAGQKPRQFRIYDKTGHRAYLLAKENRRCPRELRHIAMGFEQRWGYPQSTIISRVERQMGGGEPERMGLKHLHDMQDLLILSGDGYKTFRGFDPFTRLTFAADIAGPDCDRFRASLHRALYKSSMRPSDRLAVERLVEYAAQHGMTNTREHLYNLCAGKGDAGAQRQRFYRVWNKYKVFLFAEMGGSEEGTTRGSVLRSYSRSIHHQLAA